VIEFSEHFFIHENTPYLACAKVLTLCPNLFPATNGDKHAPPGGCW
jgi:hypothetical protein